MRRPGVSDEQPHHERCSNRKHSVVEKSDGDETRNQIGTSPEPDVLVKYIECGDSNNEQDFFILDARN